MLVQTSFASPANRYFAARNVKSIVVYGQGGDDQITIVSALRQPTEIFGDDGQDILRGGGGSNRLSGGAGQDTIYGGAAQRHPVGRRRSGFALWPGRSGFAVW